MKNSKLFKALAMLMAICITFSACGGNTAATIPNTEAPAQDAPVVSDQPVADKLTNVTVSDAPEKGTYREGVALVKYDGQLTQQMVDQLGCVSAEPVYAGSSWYALTLPADVDTVEKVAYLRELGCFEAVDYDFIMKTETADPVNAEPGQEVASGTCGENLTWTLDDNGTLTISGTGAMRNFEYASQTPWYSYQDDILFVVIGSGITGIGNNAFRGCKNLLIVTFGENSQLTSIGNNAFENCYKLIMITIPSGVTSIGAYAFSYCSDLRNITFTGNAPSFQSTAFDNAYPNAYYPAENSTWTAEVMKNYGGYFNWKVFPLAGTMTGTCGENAVWTLHEDGTLIISGEGAMYDYGFSSTHTLPWGSMLRNITSIQIESGITHVGDYAFSDCTCVSSIDFGDTLTSIGEHAFSYIRGITALELPEGLTSVGQYAFVSSYNIKTLKLPASLTVLTAHAFKDLALTELVIPAGVTTIGDAAFALCGKVKSITFEGNAPAFGQSVFSSITAKAYYPAGNNTWTADVMQNYGGTLTWTAKAMLPSTEMYPHYETHGVQDAWEYLAQNGHNPGGSPDVIIAVIDTGVDYNHIDLRNNIWVNPAEIPDNGIDDDGNGYVDDVFGWNCVGDNNNPMDDNGHGTHVAGIIAAENNDQGAVGIAYNCKIMVLKAGNSSGYFNNSDIAEAIQYAYMNGASVINMSFAGTSISMAVEEALKEAYYSCALVAAAGNNGLCNDKSCIECSKNNEPRVPFYPAALTYVIGVMNSAPWSSTNVDHVPRNYVEYEVEAWGGSVYSTWPNNKYTKMSGTSMSAPIVSAIVALLRSYYVDREVYSNKFLQSQIVNTIPYQTDVNAYAALTKKPVPEVNLFEYYIDDSVEISENNNGNGALDAGETVHLYVSVQNQGGVASNVTVSIDAIRRNELDPDLGSDVIDPYFLFPISTIQLSDVGTYSVREPYEDEYLEIVISPECPNEYLTDFNITITYTNGMDDEDIQEYRSKKKITYLVTRGYHLPYYITEDITFTSDRYYIVSHSVTIAKDVTVIFEEGCQIQFFDGGECYYSPIITVLGTLLFKGTADRMISIRPAQMYECYTCEFSGPGTIAGEYIDGINISATFTTLSHSKIITKSDFGFLLYLNDGEIDSTRGGSLQVENLTSSYIQNDALGGFYNVRIQNADENVFLVAGYKSCSVGFEKKCVNNIIATYFSEDEEKYGRSSVAAWSNCTSKDNIITSLGNDRKALAIIGDLANEYNQLSQDYREYIMGEPGFFDEDGVPRYDVYGTCSNPENIWPHVVSVELMDADGNPVTRVGKEEIKVRVTFNRPMDTTKNTIVAFGSVAPYADYRIVGQYISDTVWEGSYTLKAQIENGQNFIKVDNACAAEDPFKTVYGEFHLHEFNIDTTKAMSMDLQAVATDEGIKLTWVQDDYDTLMGYNIYRSEEKNGYYTKLNPVIVLPSDEFFLDENAEPGKTYWYTYTVVLTDFTESNPAGKVVATAMDTIAPNIYHTPVNQGYLNNNLVISCTASDNMNVASVKLYYRAIGASIWKMLEMSRQNDKFSATIFGSELTMEGMEYYIVVSDGVNTVNKGSAEVPYTVVIKDASAISRLGDVDGDGMITAKDALMIMQAIEGKRILTDDQFQRADLNKNGTLDSVEVLRILQYVNGKVTDLDMTK